MPYVEMIMKLSGDSLANPKELQLKDELTQRIQARQIGKVVGSGSGLGEMDIGVDVADLETGKSKLRKLAEEYGIREMRFRSRA